MIYSRIVGTGSYLPSRVMTNHDFAAHLQTSDAWIRERTGIVQRHIAEDGQGSSDLALHASRRALDAAGYARADIARFLGKRYQHVRNVLEGDAQAALSIGAIDTRAPRIDRAPFNPELEKRIEALKDERAALDDKIAAAGIRHAPVRDHAQVIADPDAWANGYFAHAGDKDVVAVPVGFTDTPGSPPELAPELGQHTEEVLLELGYTWDDITGFQDAAAI